ncbi:hypothetical protein [Dyadobacter sp. SG02]|uniref:hypothetical protein n=1 Tax=Dyadobacter sp. SG02 TaxID=1855291 RepID=UPI000B835CBF|nr:hypothetical protein [Dyadobacter sp. SG02]
MEKEETREAMLEELLQHREKMFEIIRNSPALRKRNEAAAASLARLPRPFPWEKEKSEKKSDQ